MMTTQIRIIDGNTIIDRDMNAEELANYKIIQDDFIAQAKTDADAQTAKALAKQAVLDKLGLSADEAQALLG